MKCIKQFNFLFPTTIAIFFISAIFCHEANAQYSFSNKKMTKILFKQDKLHNPKFEMKTTLEGFQENYKNSEIDDIAIVITPNLPQNFSKIVRDDNDEWQFSGELNFGASYGIVVGQIQKPAGENTPTSIKPFIGLALHFSGGTTQDYKDGEGLTGNLNIGGSLLIMNYLNLFVGYDLLNDSRLIGLGARVDLVRYDGFGGGIINRKQIWAGVNNPE